MKKFFFHDPKLLIYGFLIIFFASYGQTFFIALFNDDIKNLYSLTDGQFGLVYALSTTLSSLLLINFAKLIDFIDLRIYSFFVTLGLLIPCLAIYFLPPSLIYLFLIIFALRFFGQGAMNHAGITTMTRYFGKDKGKAISIGNLGGMIGVMFLPFLVVYLNYYFNFKQIWLFCSLSLLIFLPVLYFTLNNQSSRQEKFKESINKDSKKWKTIDVIKNKKFLAYLPITTAFSFIGTGLMFHQIFIFTQKGWTIEMLGTGFIFLGGFSIFGLLLGGPLIDLLNPKKAILFILFPIFFGLLILIWLDSYFFLLLYMSLYGFNLGITTPFIASLWAELFGLESLGTVKALFHAIGVLASALSPVIFGYIIDWGFGIKLISFVSLLIIIVATILPIALNIND
ncbi:MFS transporter [Pelagibacteraceae bacterium]|nr:MFS transporter [Pelagibacteraceae bacterium]